MAISTNRNNIIGKTIKILKSKNKENNNMEGVVSKIESNGDLYGNWSENPVNMENDEFLILD